MNITPLKTKIKDQNKDDFIYKKLKVIKALCYNIDVIIIFNFPYKNVKNRVTIQKMRNPIKL